jgi:HK97 family phage major capsid protein
MGELMTRLLDAVKDRRARALAAAEKLAAGPLGLNESIELEQRLDDEARYSSILSRIQVNEPPLYRHGGPHSFFGDVYAAKQSDPGARARLATLDAEQRDVGTGAFAGLTVPSYIVEAHGIAARASRPLIDAIGAIPLPGNGMTALVGKTTTATTAGQSAENAGVSETDIVTAALSLPVRTIPGRQDMSRQALERGESIDLLLGMDLLDAVDTEMDRQAIAGTGTLPEMLGILSASGTTSVVWTDATPTVPEFLVKLTSAAKQSAVARKKAPDTILMTSRRWFWISNFVDTAGQPIVPITTGPPDRESPYVGTIAGLGVILDDNIPGNLGAGTNEDRVIVCRLVDLVILETDPVASFDQQASSAAGNLSVVFVVRRYAAFTAERWPAGVAIISGSGLIDPGTW